MEKSEVIQKFICTFLWSENIKFYIFTSENIKYTIYINNIFLYFTTLYIIKVRCVQRISLKGHFLLADDCLELRKKIIKGSKLSYECRESFEFFNFYL